MSNSKLEKPIQSVSVVIPSYNSEKYLSKAIESCLGQEYEHLEVLIIDDHSTDRSLDIANEYASRNANVRSFKNRRKGANAARNFGVELSQSKFIQFLDSDDYLLSKSTISSQVHFINENNSESIVFCESASIHGENYNQLGYRIKYEKFNEIDIKDLIFDCIIQTSQLFISKELFSKVGCFNEDLIQAQEHDFNVRAASKKVKFIYNNNFGVVIRSHTNENRISNQDPTKTQLNDDLIVEKFKAYMVNYLSSNSKYSINQIGNEIIKYLVLKAQLFGNKNDFRTVKSYISKIETLKKEFGLKRINNYKNPFYTFLINFLGLYSFEYLRVNYLTRIRKLKMKFS